MHRFRSTGRAFRWSEACGLLYLSDVCKESRILPCALMPKHGLFSDRPPGSQKPLHLVPRSFTSSSLLLSLALLATILQHSLRRPQDRLSLITVLLTPLPSFSA